jgi:hypothetical protein
MPKPVARPLRSGACEGESLHSRGWGNWRSLSLTRLIANLLPNESFYQVTQPAALDILTAMFNTNRLMPFSGKPAATLMSKSTGISGV